MPTHANSLTKGGPAWGHFAVAILLLLLSSLLDVARPFDRSWSNLYILVAVYTVVFLRGRMELVLLSSAFCTVFAIPLLLRPETMWPGNGWFYRTFGAVGTLILVILIGERRRHTVALQQANSELEQKVEERTAEILAANESLRWEILEREKAQADQKSLEERLQQAQRMEAIGCLAGGVAHDFNNLLTVINGYCDALLEKGPVNPFWRDSLNEVRQAGLRAAELTQQLLAFSRKQVLQPRIVNLNQSVRDTERILRRLLPESIAIDLNLAAALPSVRADTGQLVQVLLNLASNARDAMPAGGTLAITTALVQLSAEDAGGLSEMQPGPHVRLMVSDDGQGMDEETRQRVFVPFFTTKAVGKGTGLGLASVYGIIRQSGGHIDVSSQPGCGSTFTILLPCVDQEGVTETEQLNVAKPQPHAGGTILLVEDEDQVCRFAANALRGAGYQIVTARNGREALAYVTESAVSPFDLMITDVVMPEMGGPELANLMTRKYPRLKVIFMSGYSRQEAMLEDDSSRLFLEKPFDFQKLCAKVHEALPINL